MTGSSFNRRDSTNNHYPRVRIMLMSAHGFEHIISNSLPPLFVFIHHEVGLSFTQLGLIVAVASITSAFCQIPAGWLVDRLGAKRVILGGYVLTFLGLLLLARATSMPGFVMAQVIYGMGYATYHPGSFTDVARSSRVSGLGKGMALHDVGGNLGAATGYSISALLATWLGWRLALGSLVGVGVLWALAFLFLYPRLPSETTVTPTKLLDRQSTRFDREPWKPVLLLALVALLSGMFGMGLMAFLPTFFTTTRGASAILAGVYSTILMIAGAGGSLVGGGWGDRLERPRVILISSLTTTALVLILVLVPMGVPALIVTLIALGFSQCMARPCLDALISEVSPHGRSGSAFGLVFSIVSLGGASSGPLVGFLTDRFSVGWGFLFLAALFLAHGLIVWRLRFRLVPFAKHERVG